MSICGSNSGPPNGLLRQAAPYEGGEQRDVECGMRKRRGPSEEGAIGHERVQYWRIWLIRDCCDEHRLVLPSESRYTPIRLAGQPSVSGRTPCPSGSASSSHTTCTCAPHRSGRASTSIRRLTSYSHRTISCTAAKSSTQPGAPLAGGLDRAPAVLAGVGPKDEACPCRGAAKATEWMIMTGIVPSSDTGGKLERHGLSHGIATQMGRQKVERGVLNGVQGTCSSSILTVSEGVWGKRTMVVVQVQVQIREFDFFTVFFTTLDDSGELSFPSKSQSLEECVAAIQDSVNPSPIPMAAQIQSCTPPRRARRRPTYSIASNLYGYGAHLSVRTIQLLLLSAHPPSWRSKLDVFDGRLQHVGVGPAWCWMRMRSGGGLGEQWARARAAYGGYAEQGARPAAGRARWRRFDKIIFFVDFISSKTASLSAYSTRKAGNLTSPASLTLTASGFMALALLCQTDHPRLLRPTPQRNLSHHSVAVARLRREELLELAAYWNGVAFLTQTDSSLPSLSLALRGVYTPYPDSECVTIARASGVQVDVAGASLRREGPGEVAAC
ncbi:hypothetical protein DFH06DRAFT_1152731 [Mycena polygramma]|nr:hypothetical protein DFH06DRAFT_1152731 [Mycena polygramma]